MHTAQSPMALVSLKSSRAAAAFDAWARAALSLDPDRRACASPAVAAARLPQSVSHCRTAARSAGSIESERFREYVADNPELEQQLISYNYRNRIGRPQEVAACCLYLLSDDSGFVNGADYVIDGGRTAGS